MSRDERVLITGATGTVGAATLAALAARTHSATVVPVDHRRGVTGTVWLDFTDSTSFAPALAGIDRLLLVRSPQLADVPRHFASFIQACVAAGSPHIVFLSLQGVEANGVTPHAKIEALIDAAGVPRTFLRPSFFMQNLTAAHRAEIRDRDEIDIPAGNGRTAFIDARDIGAVAALCLTEAGHVGTAYELTGGAALTYFEVADILSDVLGRTIRYRRSTLAGFIARRVRAGDALGFAAVMGAIYSVARLGKAGRLTNVVAQLLERPPLDFRQFANDNRTAWIR